MIFDVVAVATWFSRSPGVGLADPEHEPALTFLGAIRPTRHGAMQEEAGAPHHALFGELRTASQRGAHSFREVWIGCHLQPSAMAACGPPSGMTSNIGLVRSSCAQAGARLA